MLGISGFGVLGVAGGVDDGWLKSIRSGLAVAVHTHLHFYCCALVRFEMVVFMKMFISFVFMIGMNARQAHGEQKGLPVAERSHNYLHTI